MHTIRIEFQEGSGNEHRLRLFNEAGHLVDDRLLERSTIEAAIRRAEAEYGKISSEHSAALGQTLYDLLDGSQRWIAREREASRKALQIRIDVQGRLAHLPWELLSHRGRFLCAVAPGGILPIRQVGQEKQPNARHNRPLRLLFMACDPIDGGPSLAYEAEETRILGATRKSQLELEVEESGSLNGLKERLDDFGGDYFDVFHLTGHAKLADQGPVFAMETEEGYLHVVTPGEMQEVFGESWPRLIFLSGCETGKTQDAGAFPSFCEALVRVGAPAVLGWALPVFDDVATKAAQEIYEDLSAGKSVDDALLKTRSVLYGFEQRAQRLGAKANWHLLRLYCDGTSLDPLVTPRRTSGRAKLAPRPPSTQVFLDAHSKMEVCPRDRFVGRRRPLQQGLRTLRARVGEDDYVEGLLIHGMGGLGKSSLAARLCDRLRRRRLVLVGGFDEPELIRILSNHLREPAWIDVLQDHRLPLQTRLERILEDPLHQDPVLFVLDDFELNLERNGKALTLDSEGLPKLQPASLAALTALLRGIRKTGSDSRLLITCRYLFALPERTHVKSLELHHFEGPELTKKLVQLEDLTEKMAHSQSLKQRVLDLAGGNPRLLERLNRVVSDSEIETTEILKAMESVTQEFREEVLLSVLLEQLPKTCRSLLAHLSLLRLPVAWSSVEALGGIADPEPYLERADALGLIEIGRRVPLEESTVFVSTLLGPLVEAELSSDKTSEKQAAASRHLHQEWWQDSSEQSEVQGLEILRLALAGIERGIAASICADIAHAWYGQSRFSEATALCQQVSAQFEDYRVLMAQARSEEVLGETGKALDHYERALQLAPRENQRDQDSNAIFAATLANMARIVALQGDIPRAMTLWEQSLEIKEAIGDTQGKAATLSNVAEIVAQQGDIPRAMTLWEQSLEILDAIGNAKDKAATLCNMARIVALQGDIPRAMTLWEQSLEIQEAIGDARGKAATLGNMAGIMAQQGDIARAMTLWKRSLEIDDAIGDAKGKATTLNNMARIVAEQGDIARAMTLWEQSLEIKEAIGDARGKGATLGNIAGIVAQQGDIPRAMTLWEQSLEILDAIGDAKGKSTTLSNMAGIVAEKGDIPRAIKLWEQCLEIDDAIGDAKGKAAILANMAWAAGRTNKPDRAKALNLEAARLLGQARAFQDLITVVGNLGAVDEPGMERYLGQAFWLCTRVHAPVEKTLSLSGTLIQRLGPADELSPWIAGVGMLLVNSRGQEHPQLEKLQKAAFSWLGVCAQEREIAPEDFETWIRDEEFLDPRKAFPTLTEKLEALIGDAWLFDPSTITS